MKSYSKILNLRFQKLHPGRLPLCRQTALAAVLIILFTGCFTYAHARQSGTGFELEYRPMYESNIYHSYADINVTGALLNLVSARVRHKASLSTRLRHSFVGYAVFDLYSGYANRNKTSIGFVSKPAYRYTPFARVSAEIDISRRNKDLTDDSGQSLARTLKKSKLDFALSNRLNIGNLRLEQRIFYGIDDYDERDTVVITSVDTTQARLISYDYHDISWGLLARYKKTAVCQR